MQTAVITMRLKAAEPTMVDGPRAPALKLLPSTSITFSRISGAEEPSAIRVRLATVAFHTRAWKTFFSPVAGSTLVSVFSLEVITCAKQAEGEEGNGQGGTARVT